MKSEKKIDVVEISKQIQDAWDAYHASPDDFEKNNALFIKACENENYSDEYNYAKFIFLYNKHQGILKLKKISKEFSPAMFLCAKLMIENKKSIFSLKKGILFYKRAARDGHYIAKIFYTRELIKLNMKKKNFKNSFCLLLIVFKDVCTAFLNANIAHRQI